MNQIVYYEGLKKTEPKPSPDMPKDRKAQALKIQGTVPTLSPAAPHDFPRSRNHARAPSGNAMLR